MTEDKNNANGETPPIPTREELTLGWLDGSVTSEQYSAGILLLPPGELKQTPDGWQIWVGRDGDDPTFLDELYFAGDINDSQRTQLHLLTL